jgi:hypothetical protein
MQQDDAFCIVFTARAQNIVEFGFAAYLLENLKG